MTVDYAWQDIMMNGFIFGLGFLGAVSAVALVLFILFIIYIQIVKYVFFPFWSVTNLAGDSPFSFFGHFPFAKNLLSGLKTGVADEDNDGYITADELGSFLRRRVYIDSDNFQTPIKRRFTSDDGEFIFYLSIVTLYNWQILILI